MEATTQPTATQPPPATKPRLELVRVLDQYRYSAKLAEQGYAPDRLESIYRALNLLTACRTGRLGSHVYVCQGCDRSLMGLNSCNNRHCSCCGDQRRDQWREKMIGWKLDCNYFHVVFTLPHDLNPLLLVNPGELYKRLMRSATDLLRRTCQREFDCMPGISVALHTWGQRMNLHVHCHVILSAGGVSADGQQRRAIPADHPALSGPVLAGKFQRMFVRRLFHRLTRNRLQWPTSQHLPVDPAVIGLVSYHSFHELSRDAQPAVGSALDESVDTGEDPSTTISDPATDSRLRQRELTRAESRLLAVLKCKTWMVDSQPTPPEHQGPEAVINYLANYITGACISDSRLVAEENGQVTIRVKDYRAGDVKFEPYAGEEIVRRFVLHILPRGLPRVRYAGIFKAAGREERLERCRQLIAQQSAAASTESHATDPTEVDTDLGVDVGAAEEPVAVKTCNRCQCDMDMLGVLKGRETLRMIKLAESIDERLSTYLPVFRIEILTLLIAMFGRGGLRLSQAPRPVRGLLAGERLQNLERAALEALLERKLSAPVRQADNPQSTSGIPPPEKRTEAQHVAA